MSQPEILKTLLHVASWTFGGKCSEGDTLKALGADSLNILEVHVELEKVLDMYIPEKEFTEWCRDLTLGEIAERVFKLEENNQ